MSTNAVAALEAAAELRAAAEALLAGASRLEVQLQAVRFRFDAVTAEAWPTVDTAGGAAAEEASLAAMAAGDPREAYRRDAHLRRCLAALDALELVAA